jgi:trehalose 6-phosphate synthase/phosphatase
VRLILDYDGTLVPLAALPELAPPDDELLSLLRDLARAPGVEVHVVSGRRHEVVEAWLGALPVGLHAEHGFWSRALGAEAWVPLEATSGEWKALVRPILEAATRHTAGSFVEEKTVSLAWHYRAADPELSHERVHRIRTEHANLLRDNHLELVTGSKVIEVRPQGVHKGRVIPGILASAPEGAAIVAIGDDRTDEDLFAALPPSSLTSHVGVRRSRASYRLADPAAVRLFLRRFLAR